MGIRMLKNEKEEWLVGCQVEQEINRYVKKMWGTKSKLGKELLSEEEWKRIKPNEKEAKEMLNGELKNEELDRAIKKLKENKTPGEDLIANEIFKNMNQQSRGRVLKMLEQCRTESKFPEGWKETELKWIYKKADPSKIMNYRPIALTDTLYKLYTRIMTERLEKVIETYGVVTDLQNGFRSDRSCMAAVMTLNIIMARRLAQEERKPFYVAYIDISKAYDTVDHETLWQVLQESGISGTWLDNLKELYKNNYLRSYTPMGKTRAIKMERGIRQGCPLSPLLFALYANPIAIAMERVNKQKGKEPAMLMYADDMVVWGDTEKEVQEKLQVTVDMMEKLGLQISLEKTEVQYNKWAQEQVKGEGIEISTAERIEKVPYKNPKQALRYLGTWSTANMETSKGMELLKEKMENRLDKIRGIRGNPSTKVKLIRSRIVSTWNYTSAVQPMEQEMINEWGKQFYSAITMGDMQGFRGDLVYEATTRTGLGMTKLKEEYEKNRIRTLKQIMEAGERMKGRGQTPWAQKLLMEEMNKENPCMEVIKEMKTILKELGLTWTKTEEKYKAWKEQFQSEQMQGGKRDFALPLSKAQVKIGKHKIPLSMIDYFQKTAMGEDMHILDPFLLLLLLLSILPIFAPYVPVLFFVSVVLLSVWLFLLFPTALLLSLLFSIFSKAFLLPL